MPAAWTTFNGSDPSQNHEWAFLELEARTLQLRSCSIGAVAPADPVEGMLWIQNDAIPYKFWFYGKLDAGEAMPAWHAVWGRLTVPINADPDPADGRAAPLEHKALRLENVIDLPASVAGNRGLIVIKTGNGEVYVSDQPVAGGWKGLLSAIPGVSMDTVDVPLESTFGNDGVNPPTLVSKGVLSGWLFDDVAEKRTFFFHLPKNYDGVSAVRFRLWQLLNANEDAGDDIEWTGEYRVLLPATDKASKAATAVAPSPVVTDIGAGADAILDGGGPHISEVVIPQADATNPLAPGALVALTLWRASVGGAGKVSGVVAVRADVGYPQTVRHERA